MGDEIVSLQISGEVRHLMDERGIREEDVLAVLSFAETGRQFHTDSASGHRLAYFSPAKVTYWVEYEPVGEAYRVLNAYSHRMRILHGFNMASNKEQAEQSWRCSACDLQLALATVKLAYLDETFAVDLPACPSCQRVLVSEEQAVKKMALAERMLEDK